MYRYYRKHLSKTATLKKTIHWFLSPTKGSILQFFQPSLSYSLSLRSLFCLFLSGRLRQVLLYLAGKGVPGIDSRVFDVEHINEFVYDDVAICHEKHIMNP